MIPIYAHRGFNEKENTIKSFINAFKFFDGIEFDVRLTKDKIPIVIHDYSLQRTHKKPTIIHLSTFEHLKKFNIPSLIDILEFVKKNKKKCLIDIKVPTDSQFIIDFTIDYCAKKNINFNLFKFIIYINEIKFNNKIKILRALKEDEYLKYNNENFIYFFQKIQKLGFYGLALSFNDNHKHYLKNLDYQKSINTLLSKNIYLNIYIQNIKEKNNKEYFKNLISKSKNLSFTLNNLKII